MKLGISTYSLAGAINAGEFDVIGAIDWIAEQGAEHVEIVPFGFELVGHDDLIDKVRERAASKGIDISNYAIGADFSVEDDEAFRAEIERIKKEIDVVHRLGAKLMRCDTVGWRPPGEGTAIGVFESVLPRIVEACREISDYALDKDVTMTVENHGYLVNGSDRVIRLIEAVDRENYRMCLDTGNFWCVDEDPVVATKKSVPYAAMIHLKDFYHRVPRVLDESGTVSTQSDMWFKTTAGNYLKGAIVGDGDIDSWASIASIKRSGYDGYISIEFEGKEECKMATKAGLDNARKIWDAV